MAAVALWSTSFVATKIVYGTIPPITVAAVRTLIALILLELISLNIRRKGQPRETISKKDRLMLYLGGLLGITAYFILENVGLSLTTSSDAALIVAGFPAFAFGLQYWIDRQPPTRRECVGACLAITGVALIVGSGQQPSGHLRLWGNILICLAGIAWAAYNFVTRNIVKRYRMVDVQLLQTRSGFLGLAIASVFEIPRWKTPSVSHLSIILYLGIFCSLLAYFMYGFGLRKVPAAAAVALMNLVPVFGTALAVVALGETVSLMKISGGVVVICGIYLTTRKSDFRSPKAKCGARSCGTASTSI